MIYRIVMDIFFAVGIFFILTGAAGILRMPDTFCRLQAAGNIVTMGCLPILIGTSVFGFSTGNTGIGFMSIIIILLILIIYPSFTQALIKAVYKSGAKMDMTMKGDDYGRDKLNE